MVDKGEPNGSIASNTRAPPFSGSTSSSKRNCNLSGSWHLLPGEDEFSVLTLEALARETALLSLNMHQQSHSAVHMYHSNYSLSKHQPMPQDQLQQQILRQQHQRLLKAHCSCPWSFRGSSDPSVPSRRQKTGAIQWEAATLGGSKRDSSTECAADFPRPLVPQEPQERPSRTLDGSAHWWQQRRNYLKDQQRNRSPKAKGTAISDTSLHLRSSRWAPRCTAASPAAQPQRQKPTEWLGTGHSGAVKDGLDYSKVKRFARFDVAEASQASPEAEDARSLGSALTLWAASSAGSLLASVHTPLVHERLKTQENLSLSPPRKKMHTATQRRRRNSSQKEGSATKTAQEACQPHRLLKQRPQQAKRQPGNNRLSAKTPAAPAADAVQCEYLTCLKKGNRRRSRHSLQQQQQQVLHQMQMPKQRPEQPSHTHGSVISVSGVTETRLELHQSQRKKVEWRTRGSGGHAAAKEGKESNRFSRAEVFIKEAPGFDSKTKSPVDCAEGSAKPHGASHAPPTHGTSQGESERQQGSKQAEKQEVQSLFGSETHYQHRCSPRRPRSPKHQELLLLLQHLSNRLGVQQSDCAGAGSAQKPTKEASSEALIGSPDIVPAGTSGLLCQQRPAAENNPSAPLPDQQRIPRERVHHEEDPYPGFTPHSSSLGFQASSAGDEAALLCAAAAPAIAAACCTVSTHALVGRHEGFQWPLLPLGLRLLICSFLEHKELMALAAAGRCGREAADHPHVWLLRCTRKLCPCLAATAKRTAALPVGVSHKDRQLLRSKWGLKQHQLLCGKVQSEVAKEEATGSERLGAHGRASRNETEGLEKFAGSSHSSQHGSSTNQRSSSGVKGHAAVWEAWAQQTLNDEGYGFDYKRLFLDGNGWFPRGGQATRWTKLRRQINPALINTMDARQQFGCLYLASEGTPKTGGSPSAQLQVLSLRDMSVKRKKSISSKAVNCLDLDKEVLACGDDNGVVQIFNPFSLEFRGKHATSGVSSLALVYNLSATQEINDLRLCGAERQILAVRTASRYPAGLDLIDIETGARRAIPPEKTDGHWIHAVDVDSPPRRCPYSSRSGSDDFLGGGCSAACSSGLRSSSSSNVFAVGESAAAGSFSLLRLDFRLDEPVVQHVPQNKRMLWPLRMDGHKAFVNAVFGPGDMVGRIHQVDMRMPVVSPTQSSSSWVWTSAVSTDTSVAVPGGLLHLLPSKRVEDIRIYDGKLYVLTNDEKGQLSILRFDSEVPKEAEFLSPVDAFMAAEWAEPLRLLLVYEQGWTATYGNYVTVGRPTDPWGLPTDKEEFLLHPRQC